MKKAIVLAMIFSLVIGFSSFAEMYEPDEEEAVSHPTIPQAVIDGCPTKGMVKDCMDCHIRGSFAVKEVDPYEHLDLPYNWEIRVDDDGPYAYFELRAIDPDNIEQGLEYFSHKPEFKKVVINVFSPGGSVFHGWKLISVVERFYNRFHVVTQCDSAAFSAGLLTYLVGEERLASRHANFMAHELRGWARFKELVPSDLQDEAEIFLKWQTQINEWIASKCSVPADKVKEKTRYKEWWFDGVEAVEYGIATGYMVEETTVPGQREK
jgi:ATP-dependent protease ClpP protease subunit